MVVLAIVIGLRHEVGGDWLNYAVQVDEVAEAGLLDVLSMPEPAYWLVMWAAGDIHWANLVFALLFSGGLIVFCRVQPRPWLALAVAVPYLVIVLGMGYTRQGVALALSLVGLVMLARGETFKFVAWVAVGALFHRSAVLLILLGVTVTSQRRALTVMWVSVAAAALYYFILRESVDALRESYLEAQYQSEGALVRLLMNALPASLLLMNLKRFTWTATERKLWSVMAILSIAACVWLYLSPSSTAVDRLALYLIPLQIYVFTRFPDLMGTASADKRFWVLTVLMYYGVVLFVWLVYASNAAYWLPYRLYFFENL